MKNLLKKSLLYLLIAAGISVGAYVAHAAPVAAPAGLFDTILSSPEQTTDTTMALKSPATTQGDILTGYQCFTVDTGTPNVEYECGTMSGSNVINLTRNLDFYTGTSSAPTSVPYHRTGADVRQSDFPALTILSNILAGIDTINQPILYSSSISTTTLADNRNNVVSWGLLQDTSLSGSGAIAATTAAKGYVQLATGAQAAANTSVGSTGASVALSGSIASSTQIKNGVVVTNSLGTIDTSFVSSTTNTYQAGIAASSTVGNANIYQVGMNATYISSVGTTTYTVPANVTKLFIQFVSSGNAAGTGAVSAGGGAGGYSEGYFTVVPGQVIGVGIGPAGIGSGSAGNGEAASSSLIYNVTTSTTLISCTGGVGGMGQAGTGTTYLTSAGGQGSTCTGGSLNTTGMSGSYGAYINSNSELMVGVGGTTPFGSYGAGGTGSADNGSLGLAKISY